MCDPKIELRFATDHDIGTINELIKSSKSYWHYSPEYLSKSFAILQIDSKYLRENHCRTISVSDEISCFFAIKGFKNTWELEHLWVLPNVMRQGLGRLAFQESIGIVSRFGAKNLRILPDPGAKTFYQRMGAIYSGKTFQSRIPGGPEFR